jgi:hypothetical protein
MNIQKLIKICAIDFMQEVEADADLLTEGEGSKAWAESLNEAITVGRQYLALYVPDQDPVILNLIADMTELLQRYGFAVERTEFGLLHAIASHGEHIEPEELE